MKWYQMRWAQKYWGKEARERYRRYLQSEAWKTKRKAVLQAAGFRCRWCGAPATEVHHETYKRIYNERLSDLTALCGTCHKAAHTRTLKSRKKGVPAEKRGYQKPKNAGFIENASRKKNEGMDNSLDNLN
jgi:5-methylcytosine-specific restriction endonuclease McrA